MNFTSLIPHWSLRHERFRIEAGFIHLGLQRSHCDAYRALPLHHRDPFDRMLIAQAAVEDLAILTPDRRFKKYEVKVLW